MKVSLGRYLRCNPGFSFGRVRTATAGITAAVILDRMMAGETEAAIADDYDIPIAEVRAVRSWVDRLVIAEEHRLSRGPK